MASLSKDPSKTVSVQIPAGAVTLAGDFSIPQEAQGLVLFAHGSGSSRFSPRNHFVAQVLQAGRLATLLFDLLTDGEEELDARTRQLRFDIDLLAGRLAGATDWVRRQPEAQHLKIGYFGASTGAAAALGAAAQRPEVVAAVVSSGGRPDLALPVLGRVQAPTLLLVGGYDQAVIQLNEQALTQMHSETSLGIVPGAGHRYEEAGVLEAVALLAGAWFQRYLMANSSCTKRKPSSGGSGDDL
jgi:dienelactone hydrolase